MAGPKKADKLENASILVVDDNADVAALTSNTLVDLGADRPLVATKYDDALAVLKSGRISCLVLDWQKKEGRGLALVEFLRNSEDSPDPEMPIVLCTAERTYMRIVQARDMGVSEILAKPFSHSELQAKVLAALQNRRAFVRAATYVGPDRRRRDQHWRGEERRDLERALEQKDIDALMH